MNGQKRKMTVVWSVLLTAVLLVTNIPAALAAEDDIVTFADANLKQALVDAGADTGGDGELTEGELAALSGSLDLSGSSISELAGLSFATGISELNLSGNAISDITELSAMTGLTSLNLSDNNVTDIIALASLTSLVSLNISENYLDITDGSDAMQVIEGLEGNGCTVTRAPQKDIPATGVELSLSEAELCPGDTLTTLTATVLPVNAADKAVTWNSSKTSVATVSSGGVVTAVAAGTATITVTTQDGSFTDTCTISVKSPTLASSTYFIGTSAVRGVPVLTAVDAFKSGFSNNAANLFVFSGSSEYTGALVKTGLTVRLVIGGTVRASRTIIVEGDVSGDGRISIEDYSRLKLHILEKRALAFPYADAGDYNRDAKLTVADYVRLRLNILGLGDTGGPLPANLPTVSDSRIRKFLDVALAQLGKPYVWGGDKLEHGGFDCSGLIYYSLNASGYKVGRSSANSYSQYSKWDYVSKDKLKPGDLMFYISDSDPTRIGHVGIYLGNGYHVHASSDYQCIIICGVEGWYERMLSHGRRVFK